MDYIIKKLGGENAAELAKSAKNIYEDFVVGNLQAVIVSAIRSPEFNTTDKLIQLGEALGAEKIDILHTDKLINELRDFHLSILDKKLLCSKEKIIAVVVREFDKFSNHINFFTHTKQEKYVPSKKNDYSIELEGGRKASILGFGEFISSKIFSAVIDSISIEGICSKSVDLSHIVKKKELKGKSSKQIFDLLGEKVSSIVEEKEQGGHIPVLSGYIGKFSGGIEESVGRGYSDATAAICTVGLARKGYGVTLEIQKSVDGFLSADPRLLDNPEEAVNIPTLDYLMAREITGDCGAQAKLLHAQVLRNEVQEAGVKIHLFDPFSGEEGSYIVDRANYIRGKEEREGVTFVGGRRGVIFFTISSGKMFERGILTRLFKIVQDYFSVDIVSASETEVTFTIDGKNKSDILLKKVVKKIQKEFGLEANTPFEFVEYAKDKALIFCVGEQMKDKVGLMARAVVALAKNNINVEIASQGRLQRAMIFGIDEYNMRKAVNILHTEFITK